MVIVVEGTQNTRFLLGIIIAVVVSNWLADLIHTEGVYETDLEADATIIFLRPFPPKPLLPATAGEVSRLELLPHVAQFGALAKLLSGKIITQILGFCLEFFAIGSLG